MSILDGLEFSIGANADPVYREFSRIGSRAKTVATSLAGTFAALGGGLLAGVGAIGVALDQVIDAGSQMEQAETKLTTLMGSAAAAQQRLGVLFNFAATTPFELGAVVNAEVTLRGFGAAAEELLPGLIDFAATTGTDLSQAALDIGKAWSIGATGLESDGGKILRKQVELATGMDATKLSLNEFREALLETMNEGMFAGGAERLSKTMSGLVANLKDEWTRFLLNVADAGVFDRVKVLLGQILVLIGNNREALARMAEIVSGALWGGIRLTVQGLGMALDVAEFLATTLAAAGASAVAMGDALLESFESAATAAMLMTQKAGLTDSAESWYNIANAIGEARAGMKDTAVGMARWATGVDITNDKLATATELLDEAESIAAGMGGVMGDALAGGTPSQPGAGGGTDKDAERRQQELEAEIDAALSFADEMAALNDSEAEAASAALNQRLDELDAYHQEGLIQGQLYLDTSLAIYDEYFSALDALQSEAAERQAQRDEEELRRKEEIINAQLGGVASLLGSMADVAQMRDEDSDRYKKFAIAQAVMSTAMGASKALADYPFPASLIPMAAVIAAGGVQIAQIQQAHQGRVFDDSPDEVRILRQELGGVLNSQATRRYPGVAQAMNSGTFSGGVTSVQFRMGPVMQTEVVDSQLNGRTKLRQALDATRTTRGAGFTGRGAVA